MKLFILTSILSLANAFYLNETFSTFLRFNQYHNKNYDNDEHFRHRYSIFEENFNKINTHNSENHNWKMELNQFADLTASEFKSKTKCYDNPISNIYTPHLKFRTDIFDIPSEFDWVKKGAVTPVKDQAQCGSCWSFSTTGSVEGAYFLSSGKLVSLSEQQLVDCSSSFGNQGCNGGLYTSSFEYVKQNGICSESSYSYTGTDGKCNKKCKPVTKIDSFVNVSPNNENELLQSASLQPISVAIEADQSIFQFYSSGVMDSISCGNSLDHAVLIVGWGELNGKSYWKVKNSWGSSWGDDGYILIGRSVKTQKADGICGILSIPSYPVISDIM